VSDLSAKTSWQVNVDLLFHALKANSTVLNEHATHLLCQFNGPTVSRMVREASRPKNGLAYRLRLLGVIERVGSVPTAADWLDLKVLTANKNPKLREAAGRCIVRCTAAGP
jgi:hypothetical protein